MVGWLLDSSSNLIPVLLPEAMHRMAYTGRRCKDNLVEKSWDGYGKKAAVMGIAVTFHLYPLFAAASVPSQTCSSCPGPRSCSSFGRNHSIKNRLTELGPAPISAIVTIHNAIFETLGGVIVVALDVRRDMATVQ